MLLLAAYLGGALTILSPCILPVLPFVFSRADRGFLRNGVPLLLGLAATFTAVAALAALGGAWAATSNQIGRIVALSFLALMGLALLFPAVASWATRPFVGLGARLSGRSADGGASAFLIGAATGLIWAPCAGPILGLVLGGAALSGGGAVPTLAAYGLGAATSLAVALLAGKRAIDAAKRRLGFGEGVRKALGALTLAGVALAAMGTGTLARWSASGTDRIEQAIIDRLPLAQARPPPPPPDSPLAALARADAWLNGPPLTAEALKGKVVLVDFWTYSCINCIRSIPYVRAWDAAYRDKGLVTIGVHTPEFAFEKLPENVARAVRGLKISYAVAQDNGYGVWNGFANRYWPAHYLLDGTGRIRYRHFGEGEAARTEQAIRDLLAEAGGALPAAETRVAATGVEAAADFARVGSPETYLGYTRAAGFASPDGFTRDRPDAYAAPQNLVLNQWALSGEWRVGAETAELVAAPGSIIMRFSARDLHLVLGGAARFRVTLDGLPPGADAGADVDANGFGTVRENRLYQLIRQTGEIRDRTFAIEFLDPGVRGYAFTFG
jgi:cytochrome c biogenesis protein CcdA/thiol-disulfide isomerase/thioredoxin